MSASMDRLTAKTREDTGKSANRKLRDQAKIPAVVYGREVDSRNLTVRKSDIEPLLRDGALNNRLLELNVEGDNRERNVLIKDVDLDPISDNLLHVDFHQVRAEDRVQVDVPVELTGESPGVEMENGIIGQPMRTFTVDCKVKNIPERIEVDIGDLEVGDAVFVSDVTPPSGVTLLDKPERAVVTIQPPEEFDVDTTPTEEVEAIEETVEEAMEEVAEGEEIEEEEREEEPEEVEASEAEETTDEDFESEL